MFDISFPELLIILVVALLVIGPERLPRVARTMGLWVGRARSVFNSVRRDIEREAKLDELRKAEREFRKDLDLGLNEDVMKDDSGPKKAKPGARKRKPTRPRAGRSIADDDPPASDTTAPDSQASGAGAAESDDDARKRGRGDDGNT
ncbi:Sec-independent protein translocase protein TatB [Aquisalimonas sp.]|uniref:Sec-independent protein translocase protein TatB n=1 Tax=Aquisalimonas sp. TaxID=1872621 RepID=UPI0025BE3CCD|nr:Sec-independent protein translocase protein TatB [Aquisalimonas sp.]